MTIAVVLGLFLVGWVAVALLGTQAYFLGELSKPIHQRNWRSPGFHTLAKSFTGQEVNYTQRASTYRVEKALARALNRV